jgi:methylated-DNA-[protein]-cysteine S-methyltransferase
MLLEQLTIDSPLGTLRLIARGDELAGVHLPDPDLVVAPDPRERTNPVLEQTAQQLAEYFAGVRTEFDLPIVPRGSGFQERVWRALLSIPYGTTCSYGDIARSIGRPSASRAVGSANGANPIAIIVPCHRVIGASGALTGYGGGLPAKQWLLAHERRRAQPSLDLQPHV